MDFLRFFGLKEDPFKLTPDPAFFYPSSSHREGLLLMDYSVDQKEGFLLITGEPGTGKTTMLNVFLENWKSRAETAIILTPRLSPEEFLSAVAEDLDIDIGNKNKHEIIKSLRDFMAIKSSEGKRVIIIVDEAQNLPDETLEELRLLSNLETDKDKLLQIILSGQPELQTRLRSDNLRQLNQRISSRIQLKHFSPDETLDYINYRMIIGGKRLKARKKTDRPACKLLRDVPRIMKTGKKKMQVHNKTGKAAYKLTKGIPRLINMLISRALMAAYLEESSLVLPRHIDHAVKSLDHSDMQAQRWPRLAPVFIGSLAIILATGMLYIYL
ncbi:MAG: AAA family ATPase [Nitrospirae bacterium]|nr:AAA family ATPase [Nitrospirota bacterium]